ncbi:hypothetical protein CXF37_06490 [Corynebacterium bovis]|nr:hypothetical protein CXF37_06490 [Corynebacterium bovis]RRO84177.1 hypothetical protein CXF36_00970 [Corynebacterium bovis]
MAGRAAWTGDRRTRRKKDGVTDMTAQVRVMGRRGKVGPAAFLDEAERLLEASRTAASRDDAVVFAYRAACRAAGALIESARDGRRRMPAGSAWSRLRALLPEKEMWARRFEAHARFTNRVELGLERGLGDEAVAEVYRDACLLVDDARGECGYLPVVA